MNTAANPDHKVKVRLTDEQRSALGRLIRTGVHPAALLMRARVLLKADVDGPDAWSDTRIAGVLGCSFMTVRRARQQFASEGLDATLHRKKPAGRQYRGPGVRLGGKLDGKQEAQRIAAACSEAPEGRPRWTMKLLADKLVELEVVESIDPATVWRTLQKNQLKPWLKQMWVIPRAGEASTAQVQCRVRGVHGKRAGRLRPAARSQASGGLRGRRRQAVDRGRS